MEVVGSINGSESAVAPSSSSPSSSQVDWQELLLQHAKYKNASGPNKLLEIMSLDIQRARGSLKSYVSRNKDLEELVRLLKEDNAAKKQEVENWKRKYHELEVFRSGILIISS